MAEALPRPFSPRCLHRPAFMGSGSTIAAAEAVGYTATGLELDTEYFRLAQKAIPRLASLYPEFKGQAIDVEPNGSVERDEPEDQLALVLAETPPAYKTWAGKKPSRSPLPVRR